MIEPRHKLTKPVGWFALFFARKGWSVLIAAAVLLVLTLISIKNYADAAKFDRNGIETQATIVDRRIKRGFGDDSDDYYATFAYSAAGRDFQQEKKVSNAWYRKYQVGSTTAIRYLEDQPGKFESYVGQNRQSAIFLQIGALVAGLVGLLLLWKYGSQANSAVLARRYGERTTAEITGFVERKDSGKLTGRGYMVWRLKDGTRGESLDRDLEELRALGRETQIIVYVRKGDSWWEGDVGPRILPSSRVPKMDRRNSGS